MALDPGSGKPSDKALGVHSKDAFALSHLDDEHAAGLIECDANGSLSLI